MVSSFGVKVRIGDRSFASADLVCGRLASAASVAGSKVGPIYLCPPYLEELPCCCCRRPLIWAVQAPPRLQAGFCVQIYANASTAFMLRLAALAGCNELVRNPRLTDEGYVDSQGYVDSH